eukprot:SAG31_NODE_2255_length_6073_cov_2.134248_6_plen_160_part_00
MHATRSLRYFCRKHRLIFLATTRRWDAITSWRSKTQKQLGLPSRWYDDKRLQWAATSFLQPQAMLHDRLLFNSSLERGGGEGWTIDLYLDDLDTRYGGIDSVLLWHSYPNIGLDSRNQFDVNSAPHALSLFHIRIRDVLICHILMSIRCLPRFRGVSPR